MNFLLAKDRERDWFLRVRTTYRKVVGKLKNIKKIMQMTIQMMI